jgi:hypothetical protein
MWWAMEFNNPSALALFKHLGVSESDRDVGGLAPADTFLGSAEELEELLAKARELVPGVPQLLQQYDDKLEQMKAQQASRFDEDEAPFDEGLVDDDFLDDDEAEDDDAGGGDGSPAVPLSAEEIAAKVEVLKARAQAIKDEV